MFENNTMERFEMREKIYRYLKEEWMIGYFPNLAKLKVTVKVFSVRDKSIFYGELAYLEEHMIVLVHRCENGIERILPHPSLELNELVAKNLQIT